MKILLVGDYSSVHKNLKEGLIELGHHAVLFSSGDAWKKIDTDIELTIKSYGIGNIGRAYSLFKQYRIVNSLKDFDVIQFMNPLIFSSKYNINSYFIKKMIKNNKKAFLLAAGDDAFFWDNYKERFRYSPHDDWKKYDNNGKSEWENSDVIEWNRQLVNSVNGVIPIMYEYAIGYQNINNLMDIIPIPINLIKIKYEENIVKNKLVIFHGINRVGFKGTKYIKAAMERLKENYPNEVEIILDGKMPYNEYIKLMKRINVNIDQALSYSYGVNAAISLAMGKVTLSGCEPECLKAFNLESSPIINILPNEDDIYNKLVYLLHNKNNISQLGFLSRQYAEKLHSHIEVAKKFLNIWNSHY